MDFRMTFKMTDRHLKLLRQMSVVWESCESGAPAIDCKRPYGNSYVAGDIHEILTGESVGLTTSKRDELTEAEEAAYMLLHKQMEYALEVALRTGLFEEGQYECERYRRDWRKVEGK